MEEELKIEDCKEKKKDRLIKRRRQKKVHMLDSKDPQFNHPGEPRLADLLNRHRIRGPFRIKTHLALILWFPFGIIIGAIRFVTLFLFAIPLFCVFSKLHAEYYYWKYFMPLYGFVTHLRSKKNFSSKKEAPIIVCNHCTDLDGLKYFMI